MSNEPLRIRGRSESVDAFCCVRSFDDKVSACDGSISVDGTASAIDGAGLLRFSASGGGCSCSCIAAADKPDAAASLFVGAENEADRRTPCSVGCV